jgi:hypothetical protein
MSAFEVAMLICFGVSWPISIAKSIRTRIVSGKSPLFMAVLCFGYTFGIIHKLLYSMDWVILLYALNMILVAIDFTLYFKYLPKKDKAVASAQVKNGVHSISESRVRASFRNE